MANFTYQHPNKLSGPSYFGGRAQLMDRLRTLLILSGYGEIVGGRNTIKLKNDFMHVPVQLAGDFKVGNIVSKIPNCTAYQLRDLLSTAGTKNISIHKNVFQEVLHCVAHYEQASFIASFVHLYRLIEHAALYLPLVTIISKGVNNLTFAQYQQVIDNKAKADLSVLKKFSSEVLDQNFSQISARYSFSSTSSASAFCKVIRDVVDPNEISGSGLDYIEIPYKHTDRLIVGFRNQFFHYLYHERNISLKDLNDPDEFLKICMPNFLTYFACNRSFHPIIPKFKFAR